MFKDYAKIYVKAGDGGNGCVAFRREKYVPYGGPSGGDGGRGGHVIFKTDQGLSTLIDFRYKRHYKAERGTHGQGKKMHGRKGKDLIILVPTGTVIRDAESGEILADLTEDSQEFIAARGGRGGRGNTRFATPVRKAPSFAENGEPGDEYWLELELKLLADVGLVGFPNAGKSTLISKVSAARPRIADYPFTTLEPYLGVVRVDVGSSFTLADIPGLIEGAHQGAGLGHRFLRHIERTRLLVHVLDASGQEGRDPLHDFETINRELASYDPVLTARPMLLAVNKIDLPEAQENLERIKEKLAGTYEIFPISALQGLGVQELIYRIYTLLGEIPAKPLHMPEIKSGEDPEPGFSIEKTGELYIVRGPEVEKRVAMTNLENPEAVNYLQGWLERKGIEEALKEHGVKAGDTVRIGKLEFVYSEAPTRGK